MKTFWGKLISFVSDHFLSVYREFAIFLTLSLFIEFSWCILYPIPFFVIAVNTFMSFILAMVASFLPSVVKRIYMILMITIYVILGLMELSGALFIRFPDSLSILSLVLQTNVDEVGSFFHTYINVKVVLTFICMSVLLGLLPLLLRKLKPIVKRNVDFVIVLCFICGIPLLFVDKLCYSIPLFEPFKYGNVYGHLPIKDLRKYAISPQVYEKTATHPENIVIILGEAFSKSHSSLYGYSKDTNPKLQDLVDKDSLLVFKNVEAAGIRTDKSIKEVFSTSGREIDKNYWECQTLPTIMKSAGYYSTWMSNQNISVLFDAIGQRYAQLCDTAFFSPQQNNYDEILLGYCQSAFLHKNNFCVFHLMGCHEDFIDRYPSECTNFHESDYENLPEFQRKKISEYDNAVRYNDWVVSQLINKMKDKEVIILYFPDHALDLYESSDKHCGHATEEAVSSTFGRSIPFVIYASKKYRDKFNNVYESLRQCTEKRFSTKDIIFTVTDIAGYSIKDNSYFETNSIRDL